MDTKIQSTGRTVHTSNSGIEIIREFNVEPYAAHADVLRDLQGFVEDGKRTRPAQDPYIKSCFCTEARGDLWHDEQPTTSENLAEGGQDTIRKLLEEHKLEPVPGTAGAKVSAHYRPLLTAWASSNPDDPDDQAFDYLEPKFTPGVRQIPWPPGLFVEADGIIGKRPFSVPQSVASPIGVSVTDFSMRRILLDTIPWDAITKLQSTLNRFDWPEENSKIAGKLPTFRAGTLKFTGADVQNMIDAAGNRWFEVTYNWQWVQHADLLIDQFGNESDGWVTWNHVFMRPLTAKLAWYEVWRSEEFTAFGINIPNIPGAAIAAGPLYGGTDFDELWQ